MKSKSGVWPLITSQRLLRLMALQVMCRHDREFVPLRPPQSFTALWLQAAVGEKIHELTLVQFKACRRGIYSLSKNSLKKILYDGQTISLHLLISHLKMLLFHKLFPLYNYNCWLPKLDSEGERPAITDLTTELSLCLSENLTDTVSGYCKVQIREHKQTKISSGLLKTMCLILVIVQ